MKWLYTERKNTSASFLLGIWNKCCIRAIKGTSFPGLTIRWEKIWQNLLQKEAVAMWGEKKKKNRNRRKTEPQSYVSLVIMFWQYVVADETKSGNECEGIPSKNVLD